MAKDESYDDYLRAEWALFKNDPRRASALREAAGNRKVSRVLDVGCGAGQELLPFVSDGAALGIGIDLSPNAGYLGRMLFAECAPRARVEFARGTAEMLPLLSESFDLVICRLALPYTDNSRALGEMARVLRADGGLVLKIHHARYYLRKLRRGLFSGDLRSMVHAARVLFAGMTYHATGKQPHNLLTARGEAFQTTWLLRKELARHGLAIRNELPDTNPLTPSFLIQKGERGFEA